MPNPNPFYRFKPAWNYGFYPDNLITTELLQEIYQAISIAYPGWITVGVTTLTELQGIVSNLINPYNKHPIYGGISVNIDIISSGPTSIYTLSVRNNDLYVIDSSQEITITGTIASITGIILSNTLNGFTIASYSGTFAPTIIDEELKIKQALECVYINGSAIFPNTYKYDPSFKVAKSGLARGMDWQITNGLVNRLPLDTIPKQNRRIFELPKLTGDDEYIISQMNNIIRASLLDSDYNNSIYPVYDSIILPKYWSKSIDSPTYTIYQRVQIDFINISRRKFTLIGRKDNNSWLWQRFVSDTILDNQSWFDFYNESIALPYEPNQAGRWLYIYESYDFEFVDFSSGCQESPEFYPMPAKSGDQLQFNIIDANLTNLESVNIGLFEEDGTFVQKIGEADVSVLVCPCAPSQTCSLVLTHTIADADWNQYLTNLSQYNDGPVSVRFDVVKDTTTLATGGQSYAVPPTIFTTTDVQDVVANLTGLTLVQSGGFYIFSYTIAAAECGSTYFLRNVITDTNAPSPQPTIVVFASETDSCNNGTNGNQHYGLVTIPSKQGCYRFGLYSSTSNGGGGGSNCNLTFTKSLTGAEYDTWIQDFVTVMFSGTKRVGWQIDGLTQMYIYDGNTYPPPYNPQEVIAWCNTNIPGMSATIQPESSTVTWSWTVNVPCGSTSYTMLNCEVNALTEDCTTTLWTTDAQNCPCSGSGSDSYLYSLSNIINIDRADCFSTILEFWADSNAIAQGNEYYSDWKQRVRIGLNGGGEKPIIEESLYRQSNGVYRRPQNKQDLSIDLHTDFFDLETQLAMTDATRHPNLVWEGKPIFVKGDIEVATIQDFTTQSSFETLSQMKFQALLQGFQPKNSTCINC